MRTTRNLRQSNEYGDDRISTGSEAETLDSGDEVCDQDCERDECMSQSDTSESENDGHSDDNTRGAQFTTKVGIIKDQTSV